MLAHWLLFLWKLSLLNIAFDTCNTTFNERMFLMSQCRCHTKYSFRGWGFVYRYKESPITWTLFTLSNLRCASLNQIALSALGTLVPILIFLAALSSQSEWLFFYLYIRGKCQFVCHGKWVLSLSVALHPHSSVVSKKVRRSENLL